MFSKILIANRGEIAVRVIRAARALGVATVAVHSTPDVGAKHVRDADEAVDLGGGPATENYLDGAAVIAAALATGAEAIHPGYGFLSENAAFARSVEDAGLVFIGPPSTAIAAMGEKVAARALAVSAGVPLAPGSAGPIIDADAVIAFGAEHGYPLLVKASHGGGGRGMREVENADSAAEAFAGAVREATAAFGNGEVYVERYLTAARHVEVQVFADTHGKVLYLGDRDCSVQRRHQKLIEEAPAPGLSDRLRADMGEAATRLARQVCYVGAGTVEFMVEGDKYYFLEMNTRIQVEHPVTEESLGLDLVVEQIRVAAGEPLSIAHSAPPVTAVSMEARINAEDVADGLFLPSPGLITLLDAPAGDGIRWDAGYESGDEVQPYYDSLVGKLIATGPDRETARTRLVAALDRLVIDGVSTTIPAARIVLTHPDFVAVEQTTLWLEQKVDFAAPEEEELAREEVIVGGRYYLIPRFPDAPVTGGAAVAEAPDAEMRSPRGRAASTRAGAASDGSVRSPMQGTIIQVDAVVGQRVSKGDKLFMLEAMKMENPVTAPGDGVVDSVGVAVGDSVPSKTVLATLILDAA
ncbi:MAG TPA: biotin carboxylase N-terminal domain-containing protein [Pseudolysinimonas sp.]|nr:biotin carboxylase N-terminal domain-containing protein [Pseudolysinimonas sp.]